MVGKSCILQALAMHAVSYGGCVRQIASNGWFDVDVYAINAAMLFKNSLILYEPWLYIP